MTLQSTASHLADPIACWFGRTVGRLKGMRQSARRRGIDAVHAAQQQRFDDIIQSFGNGYFFALEFSHSADLVDALEDTPVDLRGFAYEGAAMGLSTRQALNPWGRSQLEDFLGQHGNRFTYLIHVGVGWTFGWVPRATKVFTNLDPILRWLAFDGMGFRDFFFTGMPRQRIIDPPRWLLHHPYSIRAYDQGIGRCVWFASGADSRAACSWVNRFPSHRQPDLWAGVGLAAVYAGIPDEVGLITLRDFADSHCAELAQGAAFAAKALDRGGQINPWHDAACQLLCGTSATAAAAITDRALDDLPIDGMQPAYEEWRRRIQKALRATPNLCLAS